MSDFKNLKVTILTVSDSCSQGLREDESGQVLKRMVKMSGAFVVESKIVGDDASAIKKFLKNSCDYLKVDLVLTTGGTGLGPRDITPEVTRAVIKKEIPGIPELMRFKSFKKTERAALSRAVAGVRANALIINLPGSPNGAQESFLAVKDIIPHAILMIKGLGHECSVSRRKFHAPRQKQLKTKN